MAVYYHSIFHAVSLDALNSEHTRQKTTTSRLAFLSSQPLNHTHAFCSNGAGSSMIMRSGGIFAMGKDKKTNFGVETLAGVATCSGHGAGSGARPQAYLLTCSILPVSSATRALIRATRDSMADEVLALQSQCLGHYLDLLSSPLVSPSSVRVSVRLRFVCSSD
jgi:hypothetical protein